MDKIYATKSAKVTDEAHAAMIEHLGSKIKIVHWVSEAILEKIEREKQCEKK